MLIQILENEKLIGHHFGWHGQKCQVTWYIYVIYTYVKNEQMEWSKVTFYMLVQIQKS